MRNFQQGSAHILAVLLLLAGIGVGAYLVQNPTNFLPKASSPKPISLTPTPSPTCKEGVDTFSVNTPCDGGYRYANYTCYDGVSGILGDPVSCKSSDTWVAYAKEACAGHSSCTLDPKQKPPKVSPEGFSLVPSPSPKITVPVSINYPRVALIASVLLKDKSGSVVTDQSKYSYIWKAANPKLIEVLPYAQCTNGIQPPCPSDHASIRGLAAGSTTIEVTVSRQSSGKVIASTIFEVTIIPPPTPTAVPTPTPPAATPTPGVTIIPTINPTTVPLSKRVFVTSTTYNGNLGGLSGADAKCQERANVAGLTGTYKAWLSDSQTSAAYRLNHFGGPYILLNRLVIANNWADLTDNSIINPIRIDETGIALVDYGLSNNKVITGTNVNGDIFNIYGTCSNWSTITPPDNEAGNIGGGSYTSINSQWTQGLSFPCSSTGHLYCFEQ
ncbi:MAG: DUF1554 domain-containing protein [bacterium]|nr:DUF1554 domain-containing protein [bacterium]